MKQPLWLRLEGRMAHRHTQANVWWATILTMVADAMEDSGECGYVTTSWVRDEATKAREGRAVE